MGKVKEYYHDQIIHEWRTHESDIDDEYKYEQFLKQLKNEKTSQRDRNSD